MNKRAIFATLLLLMLAVLLPLSGFAQETTAGIQGVVKDATGSLVTNASIEVTSPALIGKKVLLTNASGAYHFTNLPPGTYTLTVTAPGFRQFKHTAINLDTGRLPTLDVTLVVGGSEETVEVTGELALVDVSQSRVQTNITEDLLANIPKGRSFQSVIQLAPGARTEPLQSSDISNSGARNSGYQIGGASNSENAYLVEGQETASPFDGRSASNVPMEFIQEVQVKTNGFEAEFGGALGGVVNVVQKRGSNDWHGSAFLLYQGSRFDAGPNRILLRDPQTSPVGRTDQSAELYSPKKDRYSNTTPGFDLGGSILKNRLWAYLAFAPELTSRSREINFVNPYGKRNINQTFNTYYANGRLDWLATQKIRLFGSWTYQYARLQGYGMTQTAPYADSNFGQYNQSAGNNPDNYTTGLATVYPNSIYNFGGDYTITPNIISTTRFGWLRFDNGQTRGTPVGIRYYFRDTNYNYGLNVGGTSATHALNGDPLPSSYQGPVGWSNIGDNTATQYDLWKNLNFNQDFSFFKKGWAGTHTFKVGYGMRKGENNIMSGYNTADVYVAYAQQYFANTDIGATNCNGIIAQNSTLYGTPGGTLDTSCQGLWGTVNIRDLGTTGKVGGINHSLYFQDTWTVGKGVTLNLGLRMDKEDLPTYDKSAGFKGIAFGWGKKMAPRLGASWDVLGNGKIKAYGSFGYFFDIMKYNLSRGSFGGDYWHDCVYALDTPNFNLILPSRDQLGHYCPLGGGNVGANGTLPAGLRFIENYDYRQPSNDPNNNLIDPNLSPMKQHSMTLGTDWAITPSLAFNAIYTRTRLDNTIEDAGILTSNGEQYYIVNPGFGINKYLANCDPAVSGAACTNPKAVRNYDGVEFRLTRRANKGLNGSLSYTYSALRGNYSGLTSTDVSDSIGRNGANTDRAFDEPFMSFDAHGKAISGPLGTDRPHTFKAYGYYNLKWLGMNTLIGFYQQVYQGTPLSSYASVYGAPVFFEGRGKFINFTTDAAGNFVMGSVQEKRTPIYSNSDFNLAHEFRVSKTNEKMLGRFEVNVSNLFNQHSPVIYSQSMIRTGQIRPTGSTPNYLSLQQGYDYISSLNARNLIPSSLYGQPSNWQGPRTMRFKVSFSF